MTQKKDNHTHTGFEARMIIEKIVVNAGVGRIGGQNQAFEEKILPQITRDIAAITGQKPEPRSARKSIAGFKVREGQVVGVRVTLRRAKMVDFFTKLVTIVLPRVRDFHGIDTGSVDEKGVLNMGVKEQIVFPEIDPETSTFSFSLGINIVPRKKNREEALEAFRALKVPFVKDKKRTT
ncbi:MAG: 50S ribosomal protein L5 [Patescibacteria group bacterium]|nr:50S ribosomal protein L5 [Patescibacteria group bacterium]